MTYRKSHNYVLREVHDTYFFIDITDNYKEDRCSLLETNEIGAFIWEHLGEGNTTEKMTALLMNEIKDEVPYNAILEDVGNYLNLLSIKGIVREEDAKR